MKLRLPRCAASWLLLAGLGASPSPEPLAPLVAGEPAATSFEASFRAIDQVGRDGAGSAEARRARDLLARQPVAWLPELLPRMDGANPVAMNWYRTAYEEIVARGREQADTPWPRDELKQFVSDPAGFGRTRRLVLALLDQLEPDFRTGWIPTRLADPEFRFDAVQAALADGERSLQAKDTDGAKQAYRRAFDHARDGPQVTQAAAKLRGLGESADVIRHLGLLVDWWVVGPFDAPNKSGFARKFEPEAGIDLQAAYAGKAGEIRWQPLTTHDTMGQVNLITHFGPVGDAVAYAYTEVELAEVPRGAQLRCGADDNCSVWLNGQLVFAKEQWLNGTRFDRFITPVELRAGLNRVLVKICQGPQHKDPEVPNNWSLQLRLCDAEGRGLSLIPLRLPSAEQEKPR